MSGRVRPLSKTIRIFAQAKEALQRQRNNKEKEL